MAKRTLASIVMLGDVMLGRLVDEALSVMPERAAVWGDTLPLLAGGGMTPAGDAAAQLVAANLECAVTDHPDPAPKTFNFKLSPANVDALTAADVAFVSLANNHSLDYFEPGLAETMRALDTKRIAYAGVGVGNALGVGIAPAAAAPAVVERGGVRVAFLSYSDHPEEWAATDKRLGINFIDPANYDAAAVQAQIQAAAAAADAVVVFVHWGPNWAWRPAAPIRALAHEFIDAGATAVFGHSAHHIQGIEVRRGRPIVYGAGGFIDDYALDAAYRNDLGFVYCMHVDPGPPVRPLELELVPVKIWHRWREGKSGRPPYFSSVQRATGTDAGWLGRTLRRLCAQDFPGTRVVDAPRGLKIPLA